MCDIGCAGHNPPTAIKHFFFLLQYSGNRALKYSCIGIVVFFLLVFFCFCFSFSEVTRAPKWLRMNQITLMVRLVIMLWFSRRRWGAFPPTHPDPRSPAQAPAPSSGAGGSPPISRWTVISLRRCCHLLQQLSLNPPFPTPPTWGEISCTRVTWGKKKKKLNKVFLFHLSQCYRPINYDILVSAVLFLL